MSCQEYSTLTEQAKNQIACNLAALILHDDKSDVTSENLTRIVNESGLRVPAYWPILMAKALEGKDVADFLQVSGGGSGGQGQ